MTAPANVWRDQALTPVAEIRDFSRAMVARARVTCERAKSAVAEQAVWLEHFLATCTRAAVSATGRRRRLADRHHLG